MERERERENCHHVANAHSHIHALTHMHAHSQTAKCQKSPLCHIKDAATPLGNAQIVARRTAHAPTVSHLLVVRVGRGYCVGGCPAYFLNL